MLIELASSRPLCMVWGEPRQGLSGRHVPRRVKCPRCISLRAHIVSFTPKADLLSSNGFDGDQLRFAAQIISSAVTCVQHAEN